MIQANELRIGNLIFDPKGNIIEVLASSFVMDMNPEATYSLEDCNPIPLTLERLAMCHFNGLNFNTRTTLWHIANRLL